MLGLFTLLDSRHVGLDFLAWLIYENKEELISYFN